MTPSSRISTVIMLIAGLALPAWGQNYFLYAPQPAASGQKPAAQEVLVQEIEIRKGDTLYGLSRKYSGKGMYYPQILLFNSIANPNLIYPGKTLKVPVSQNDAGKAERTDAKSSGSSSKAKVNSVEKKTSPKAESPTASRQPTAAPASTASTELSLSDLKTTAGKGVASRHKKRSSAHAKKSAAREPEAAASPTASARPSDATSAPDDAAGQKLFEAAVKAYRKDDCKTALELLDRYLADNSGSPLAADAALYKAECYLKLSAQ